MRAGYWKIKGRTFPDSTIEYVLIEGEDFMYRRVEKFPWMKTSKFYTVSNEWENICANMHKILSSPTYTSYSIDSFIEYKDANEIIGSLMLDSLKTP